MPRVRVSITNLQTALPCNDDLLRRAVDLVFRETNRREVEIGIAVVDDATIHELNRRHLEHDWATDVLSFPLEDSAEKVHGEIVVSADTAHRSAPSFGWSYEEELCLYVVHGALHLAGYRDKAPAESHRMRAAEREVLAKLGIQAPDD